MKNFRLMVKMMVMALAIGALFCSCNAAGGSDCYDAQSSRVSTTGMNGNGTAASRPASFSIIIPEINVSVSGADRVKQSASETTVITAEATEGASFMWYVNGILQDGENGTTYELTAYTLACMMLPESHSAQTAHWLSQHPR